MWLALAELAHSLEDSDRRRNTPKSCHNRWESVCAGLWVSCRICWAWFGPALGPNPARNRGVPAGSSNVFGALLAQLRGGRWGTCTASRRAPRALHSGGLIDGPGEPLASPGFERDPSNFGFQALWIYRGWWHPWPQTLWIYRGWWHPWPQTLWIYRVWWHPWPQTLLKLN